MKIYSLFFLFLFSVFSLGIHAQSEVFTGNGQYFAEENEPLTNIKEQLIHSAFKDVLTKSLTKLNLNVTDFWKKYETEFEQYFKPIQISLARNYKEGDPKQTDQQKTEFLQKLKEARNREYKNFGGVAKVVQSFSIKELNSDPNQPLSKNMILEAKVNINNVFKIYDDFIKTNEKSNFEKLYLSFSIDLNNVSSEFLGVKDLADITKVVNKYWSDYLKQNGGSTFKEIILLNTPELSSENDISKAAWLRVYVKVLNVNDFKDKGERELSFEMQGIVIDLNTNSPIFAWEKNSVTEKFDTASELSSKVATTFYRMPLKSLKEMNSVFANFTKGEKRENILVQNYQNFGVLDQLKDLILQKTLKYRTALQISSFTLGNAELVIEYSGDSDQFKNDLLTIDNNNLSAQSEYLIKILSKEKPFTLAIESKLTQNGKEVKSQNEVQPQN